MNSVDQHEKTLREWYVLSYQVKYYKFNTNTCPQCEQTLLTFSSMRDLLHIYKEEMKMFYADTWRK